MRDFEEPIKGPRSGSGKKFVRESRRADQFRRSAGIPIRYARKIARPYFNAIISLALFVIERARNRFIARCIAATFPQVRGQH
jgi:hypothetical protein